MKDTDLGMKDEAGRWTGGLAGRQAAGEQV